MKLRIARIDLFIGYEAIAAMTAVLLLDRDNRVIFCFLPQFCTSWVMC